MTLERALNKTKSVLTQLCIQKKVLIGGVLSSSALSVCSRRKREERGRRRGAEGGWIEEGGEKMIGGRGDWGRSKREEENISGPIAAFYDMCIICENMKKNTVISNP